MLMVDVNNDGEINFQEELPLFITLTVHFTRQRERRISGCVSALKVKAGF